MKRCFKCEISKPLDAFYKHSRMADGHLNKCKECAKKDVRTNRAAKIDHYREYDKKRFKYDPRVKARHKRYADSENGKISASRSKKKWCDSNPVKRSASCAVGNAVRDGKLEKSEACEKCGAGGRIHGHHDDYAKPLEVRWLCPACHKQWHNENGEAANAS